MKRKESNRSGTSGKKITVIETYVDMPKIDYMALVKLNSATVRYEDMQPYTMNECECDMPIVVKVEHKAFECHRLGAVTMLQKSFWGLLET